MVVSQYHRCDAQSPHVHNVNCATAAPAPPHLSRLVARGTLVATGSLRIPPTPTPNGARSLLVRFRRVKAALAVRRISDRRIVVGDTVNDLARCRKRRAGTMDVRVVGVQQSKARALRLGGAFAT